MQKEKSWLNQTARVYLKDVLPLSVPLSIQIDPTRDCNFKCVYCNHIQDSSETVKSKKLSLSVFKKFINDCKGFEKKIKVLTFSGLGEPLLNKDLVEMIILAKQVSEKVSVVTNGSLLTTKKTDELINAGLDILRISLQGLNSDDYKNTCSVKIDFGKFYQNIEYFYNNKKQCKLYLKMPDIALNTEEKTANFYKTFENVSDGLIIESISPIRKEVDFKKIKEDFNETMYQEKSLSEVSVCPQPFYMLTLTAEGLVIPCCMIEENCYVLGDIKTDNVVEIWNNQKINELRLLNLQNKKQCLNACKNCNIPKYYDNEYNNIDEVAVQLVEKYKFKDS